jgi:hypothetical protein
MATKKTEEKVNEHFNPLTGEWVKGAPPQDGSEGELPPDAVPSNEPT